jgi:hypothetical protein
MNEVIIRGKAEYHARRWSAIWRCRPGRCLKG